jgi:hypothetical protein
MAWYSDFLSPAWTAAQIAFTPTELNVGEQQYLDGYEAGGGGHGPGFGHFGHYGHGFGNDFGHDSSGSGFSGDSGSIG